MSDKLGPTSPLTPPANNQLGSPSAGWTDPRLAAKSKLASATSVEVDPSLDLDSASAQLSALRNQANAAAASGDVSALQQLAVHAVALGVAAGQHAETLANAIAAKVAASGGTAASSPQTDPAQPADDSLTALGLKPADIEQLFTGSGASDIKAPTGSTGSGIASGLDELAALNARAGAVISDARSLLAAMNQTVGSAADSGEGETVPAGGSAEQGLTLNGLAQLLDQAEGALAAKTLAIGQQLAGAAAPTAEVNSAPKAPGVDLKT
jgi:hypothetical protein